MKTNHIVIAAIIGFGASSAVMVAADDAKNDQKVLVEFVDAEKFSDVADAFTPTEKGQAANLEQINHYVQKRAAKYLAEDQKLEVTFTNIDLAGEFEPWGQGGHDDIRVVKGIYPPRFDLSFRLMDGEGNVVKEGTRELRDLGFMMNLRLNNSDPIRYEKTMLDDWMRKELKSAKS